MQFPLRRRVGHQQGQVQVSGRRDGLHIRRVGWLLRWSTSPKNNNFFNNNNINNKNNNEQQRRKKKEKKRRRGTLLIVNEYLRMIWPANKTTIGCHQDTKNNIHCVYNSL